MHLINWWSSIGLILDITGVILLFEFGLPSKISEGARKRISISEEREIRIKKENKRITILSYIGLALVIVGFAFQLMGSNQKFINHIFRSL